MLVVAAAPSCCVNSPPRIASPRRRFSPWQSAALVVACASSASRSASARARRSVAIKQVTRYAMSSKTISLKRLVSQCVDLAERAGHHIRTVSGKLETSGSLQMHDKGLGTGVFDPQTIADRQAQRCIVENLRAVYGMDLHVVGEEGELGVEEEGEDIVIREPMEDLLDGEWSEASDLHLPISELCVWVDPLDGTREFTEQRYEYVSTLIGISRQNRPVAGVISEPYPQPGRILWGCCQAPSNQPAPGVHVYGSPDWSRPARDPPSRCLAILSRSRAGGVVEEALERLSEPGTGEGAPAAAGE